MRRPFEVGDSNSKKKRIYKKRIRRYLWRFASLSEFTGKLEATCASSFFRRRPIWEDADHLRILLGSTFRMFAFQGTADVPWLAWLLFCYNWEIKVQGKWGVCCLIFWSFAEIQILKGQASSSSTIYSMPMYVRIVQLHSLSSGYYGDDLLSFQPRYWTAARSSTWMSKPCSHGSAPESS